MMRQAWHLPAFLGIVTGIFLARQGVAETPSDAVSLLLTKPIESSFSADEIHSYTIQLAPGYYLLTVEQGGLDLRVAVASTTTISVNSASHRDDRETAMLKVLLPSLHTITIDSDEYTGTTAHYSIEVRPLDDARIIEAYRLMTDAAIANERGGT